MRPIFNTIVRVVPRNARGGRPAARPDRVGSEHLLDGVTHVGHYLQHDDLAVRVKLDVRLRRDLHLAVVRRVAALAVAAVQLSVERDRHLVGDDELVGLIGIIVDLDDADVLSEVREREPLPSEFVDELLKGQVGCQGLVQGCAETRGGVAPGLCRLATRCGGDERRVRAFVLAGQLTHSFGWGAKKRQ